MKCAQVVSLATLLVLCTWSSAQPPQHFGILNFGLDMYKEIHSKNTEKNVFFSPTSISTALSMLHLGAGGKTKTQLKRVLKFNSSISDVEIYKEYKGIVEALARKNNDYTVNLIDQLFGSTKFTYNQGYQKESLKYFRSMLEKLNFSKIEESRKHINEWVSKKTGRKILEFLPKGIITPSTVLEIIDTIHVEAQWKHPFNKEETKSGPFKTSKDKQITMKFMHLPATLLNYTNSKELECEIVELPLVGEKLSMYVLLPKKLGLETVQKKLTPAVLIKAGDSLKPRSVEVNLPKFLTDQRIPLMNHLTTLGLKDVFDAKNADLTRIAPNKDGLRLYASETIHKTLWRVDEVGINSDVKPLKTTPSPPLSNPIIFNVNRPFMIMIKEKICNVPLLCGHVVKQPVSDDVLQ